ncbi:MAG: S9 family peptidase [Phycisphaerales bacterium]|nr:S9 family peptidase [Phycisphaerales bacterium]
MSKRRTGISPEDLQQLVVPGQPRISPDGQSVLFARKHAGPRNTQVSNLWVVDVDGGKPRQLTSGEKDSHGRWSPDGSAIAFISNRDKGRPQLRLLPADGGESRAITDLPEGSMREFKWSPNGEEIAFAWRKGDSDWSEEAKARRKESGESDPPRIITTAWYRLDGDGYFQQRRFKLLIVNVATGKVRTTWDKDDLGFFSFDFSPDGRRLAVSTVTGRNAIFRPSETQLRIIDLRSGKSRQLDWLPRGPKDSVCWSPDGRWLAWAGRKGEDDAYGTENLELWICDPARRNSERCLSGKTDLCLMAATLGDTGEVDFSPSLQWTKDSRNLLVRIGWHGAQQVYRFARRGGEPTPLTSGFAVHDPGNLSEDGSVLALMVETPTRPPEVHVMDLRSEGRPRRLTNANGAFLKERHVAKPSSHWVKSPDGNRVQVWMLTPPTRKSVRNCPAVLQIHGGPHGQYGFSFFHEFQCQAAQGWVVVYSNPRGSKGYGRDFCAAIRGAWGTADWVDIRAVIDWMRERPEVNVKKMAVMGGSYGGYMTNWVMGHTNEFACAITDRCVSDLVSMAGNSDFIDRPDGYFEGNAWDRIEPRRQASPMRLANNWKTPTLVIHSEGDLRCNVEQAEQVWAALQLKKVPSRFVRYPASTSHGLSRGGPTDLRLHRLHEILDWLGRYIGKGRRTR